MDLIDAIAMVESGNNDAAKGKHGEVSRWQILPSTWRQYSSLRNYKNPVAARKVAELHLISLYAQFTYRSGHGNPRNLDLAVMWQIGFAGYESKGFDFGRLTKSQRDRAQRILNLINDKTKQ